MPARFDELVLTTAWATAGDCPVCGKPGALVSPGPCEDGHGEDCPDRLCLDCGIALMVDPVVAHAAVPGRRSA